MKLNIIKTKKLKIKIYYIYKKKKIEKKLLAENNENIEKINRNNKNEKVIY